MELKWEINRDISEQILHIDIRQEHVIQLSNYILLSQVRSQFEFIANTRSWYLVKILHYCTTYIWMLSLMKGLNCLCYVCTYSLRMWCNDKRCGGGGLLATSPHLQPRQRSVSRHCLRNQHRTEHTQHMETWKHVTSLHCAIVPSFMQVLFNCLQMSSQHKIRYIFFQWHHINSL